MFRKNYLIFVLMIAAVLFGSVAAFAQIAPPVTGRVIMKDANGKEQPVAGATVEVYRIDISSKLPSDKTSKKGEFAFAGVQFGAVYALVVSGEGIDPSIFPNVRAGASNLKIEVVAGEGRKLTEEEVREQLAIAASGGTAAPQPSAEDKKKAEDFEKEKQKNETLKAKAEETFAASTRLLKEGNEAFEKKNYDLAISKFEEGYKVNPEFVGSAPGFLNNKGIVLGIRAVEFFNKGVNAKDDKEAKAVNYAKAIADFNEGIDAFYASWMLLKNTSNADKAANPSYESNKSIAFSGSQTLLGYAVQTEKIDPAKLDKVKELTEGYVNFEADKTKKAEAMVRLATYYRLSDDLDSAIAEYRKALAIAPDEPNALFGLGISLVSIGYNDDGSVKKPQLQEAANLLKRFTDSSSTNKKAMKDAADTLQLLEDGGITPKK